MKQQNYFCVALTLFLLLTPAPTWAQTTFNVGDDASLRSALSTAAAGDAIVLTSNITLTAGDLPSVAVNLTIDGQGHALSGNNQFRGLLIAAFGVNSAPAPITVGIQNLTIQNTLATGGAGGVGTGGGGGGAGLGGALFIGQQASVTVSNVSLNGNAAAGGNGGNGGLAVGHGGGGGGLGGAGGAANVNGAGGGGGVGASATGGDGGSLPGGPGTLTGVPSSGGGAGGGFSDFSGQPGGLAITGFGGGAGGAMGPTGATTAAGFGGGGGGDRGGATAGLGGFGGGGGGSDALGTAGSAGIGGGDGAASAAGGGGGGAGLGGALFVQAGGTLQITGTFLIDGSSASGGAGGAAAANGSGAGASLFLQGFSYTTFAPAAGQTATITGSIADEVGSFGSGASGQIYMQGAGKLVLSGDNRFAGGLFISNGTVSVASDANLGSSGNSVRIANGGTLELTGTGTFARPISLDGGIDAVSVAPGQTATWTGLLSESETAAALRVTGGGTLALTNGTNSYSLGTIVNGNSELIVAANGALGVTGNAPVFLGDASSGGTLGINAPAFTSPRSIVLGAGGGTIDTIGSTAATLSGAVSGGGSLTKNGGGTLTLSGANSYSGATVVNQGILQAGSATAFGSSPTLTVNSAGTADFNGFNQIFNSVAGTGKVALSSGASLTVGGDNSSSSLDAAVSGSGALIKAGSGTLTLNGSNTFTGGLRVNAGTLGISSDANLGGAGTVSMADTTAINFSAGGLYRHDLSLLGAGALNVSSGADVTWGGTISGAGGLVKAGSGTLALTGANTFAGGLRLNAGALSISSDGNLGGSGALSMADGTTLNIGAGGLFTHDLSLTGATALNAGAGSAVTWSGAISGSGALRWTGVGSQLTLTNTANSYSGGTAIAGGSTLSISSDGVLGSARSGLTLGDTTSTATLSADGVFTIARPITLGALGATIATPGASSITLAGGIGGAGGLTKAGSGTLTLGGANTYAGPTIVLGGRIAVGRVNALSPNSSLMATGGTTFDLNGFSQTVLSIGGAGGITLGGATLTLGGDGSSSFFAGVLGGGGGVVKNGAGTLSLTGANAFSNLTVNGGTVAGNVTSLPGDIVNNALLVFDQPSSGTYGGRISGSGALVKIGNGALTLAGVNSYTGGTLLNAGSIVGTTTSLQGAFVNNGELIFDQPGDGTFLGVITGPGGVTKQGVGLVNLTGSNGFTGLTRVVEGTLGIDAGLPGSITVGASGGLRGAGTIGGSLDLSGALTIPVPGGSQATFNARRIGLLAEQANKAPSLFISGDFTAARGSTLNLALSPGGAPPIVVAGKTVLQGTHVNFTVDDPNPSRSATYVALTSGQGLTASGVTASSTTSDLVPVIRSDNSSLLVTLLNLAVPLQNVATTANGGAVAGGLDKIKSRATGDLGTVVRELAALDDAHLDTALKDLSGEIHATALRLTAIDAAGVTSSVRDELSAAEHDDEDNPLGRNQPRGRTLRPWIRFSADHASFNSNGSSGTANVGGSASGVDFKPAPNWTVGGGAALSLGGMSLSDVSGSSKMTAPRAFAYTGVGFGPFHLHGGGSGSRAKTTTQRNIQFRAMVPNEKGELVPLSPDGIDRDADSDQSANSRDAWTELQDTFKRAGWIFDSKVAFRAAHLDRNAFRENGADALSLDGASSALKTREGTFEGHYYRRTGSWRPNILVSFTREVGDDTTEADVNFADNPDSQFVVRGAQIPVNTFHGLFGLTMRTLMGLEYTFEYETQQAKGESHNSVHFRMRFR